MRAARARRGITVLDPSNAVAPARAFLRRGGMVAMMIDQVPMRRRHSVEVTFLCEKADCERAPFALAATMRAPVVVAAAWRDPKTSRHHLEVLTVLEPPERARRQWALRAPSEATRALDKWVHVHPPEWLWLHRRWVRPALP
jgi:KDO2-lipid IV(A) lauroyltransferase